MVEQQSVLDRWFLQQEVIEQLLGQGEDREDAEQFGKRIASIAATEEAEHQSLHDPFDRSVALVLSLVRDCLLYTSPSPRDVNRSRMPSSA